MKLFGKSKPIGEVTAHLVSGSGSRVTIKVPTFYTGIPDLPHAISIDAHNAEMTETDGTVRTLKHIKGIGILKELSPITYMFYGEPYKAELG